MSDPKSNDLDPLASHELARAIVDTVREPLLILDHELRVRAANRSLYLHFNVTPEETEGRFVYEG